MQQAIALIRQMPMRMALKMLWQIPQIRRTILFGFVGAMGVIVNLVAMLICARGFGIHGAFASVLASLVAIVHNFILHDRLTWSDRKAASMKERFVKAPTFLIVSFINLAIAAIFVQLFVWVHWDAIIGQLVGIAVGMVWSFWANDKFTWKQE